MTHLFMSVALRISVLRLHFRGLLLMAVVMAAASCGGDGDGSAVNPPPANALASPSPSAAAKVWFKANLIELNSLGNAYVPRIAADSRGNALAVWSQFDGLVTSIWSNQYVAGVGWGKPILIETDDADDAYEPQIAFDGNGNAVAVWKQTNVTKESIWVNRYIAGSGWGSAELIENITMGRVGSLQLAMNRTGNLLLVWSQSDSTNPSNIWSKRYTLNTGWGAASMIETNNVGNANNPKIAIDSSGNGLAIWSQYGVRRTHIWANRYTSSKGWGVATLVETNNLDFAANPQIAMDDKGNTLAVWSQNTGSGNSIWSNRYITGVGWGMAALIETNTTGSSNNPQIAIDGSGNALAIWDHSEDGIRVNHYTSGIGWGTVTTIVGNIAGGSSEPQIVMDDSGNATTIWKQSVGTFYSIWASRYSKGVGWGKAAAIAANSAGDADSPQVAIDDGGNVWAVWSEFDGTSSNIWSNSYR
jgi:hypothetical protein